MMDRASFDSCRGNWEVQEHGASVSHCHLPFQHAEDLVEFYRTWDREGVRVRQSHSCAKPLAVSVPVISQCSYSRYLQHKSGTVFPTHAAWGTHLSLAGVQLRTRIPDPLPLQSFFFFFCLWIGPGEWVVQTARELRIADMAVYPVKVPYHLLSCCLDI